MAARKTCFGARNKLLAIRAERRRFRHKADAGKNDRFRATREASGAVPVDGALCTKQPQGKKRSGLPFFPVRKMRYRGANGSAFTVDDRSIRHAKEKHESSYS